jgi:hypothetical protein
MFIMWAIGAIGDAPPIIVATSAALGLGQLWKFRDPSIRSRRSRGPVDGEGVERHFRTRQPPGAGEVGEMQRPAERGSGVALGNKPCPDLNPYQSALLCQSQWLRS